MEYVYMEQLIRQVRKKKSKYTGANTSKITQTIHKTVQKRMNTETVDR